VGKKRDNVVIIIKSLYQKVRSTLPQPLQINLSKVIFKLARRPFYDDGGFQTAKKSIVTISSDFELAWAWRYSKRTVQALAMAKRERENIHIILDILNNLHIPITWAVVGHLFLDSCTCQNGKPHGNLLRPRYFENEFWKYDTGDWFDIDPCGNYKTHPEFYAPDIIETILQSNVKHEIGCHSFSHIDYSERNSYPDLIENDLLACKEAAERFGITMKSFVFPGNVHGNFNLLKKNNYKVVRYKTNDLKEIGFPEMLENGMVAIHDSMAFDQSEEGWGSEYLVWKMNQYVQKAIEKKAICHFWFHPSIAKTEIDEVLIPVMRNIVAKRDQGFLDIRTMGEYAVL
jgi:hypothetical protein